MTTSRYARRQKLIALVAVGLLVVGLGGTAIAVAASGGDDAPTVDTSPVLTLSRTSSGLATGEAASAASSSTYVLRTTLPTTTQEGAVITPANAAPTEAQVTKLLRALGLKGTTPTRVTDGWTAAGTVKGMPAKFALDEKAGNLWQYGRGPAADCLAINPGAAPDVASSCSSTSGQIGDDPNPGPGKAALLRDAKDVFALVGVTPGSGLKAHDDKQGGTYLDIPLTIESLPVAGLSVSVGVDGYGIFSALGVLDPTYAVVGQYPLISAQAAYEQLAAGPVPEVAASCPAGAQCVLPKEQKVTGARLAWLTSQESGRTVFVPAWQFEVNGFYGPAIVAVDPQYLAASSPAATPADTGAASSEPGSPGRIEPAPPSTVSPPRDR